MSFLNDKGYAYEYIGNSFRELAKWKYFILRVWLATEKNHLSKRSGKKLRKIRSLKEYFAGPALIIGNGPSSLNLMGVSLENLRADYTVFCMNMFYRSELANHIDPDYLLLCDDPFWSVEFSDYKSVIEKKQAEGDLVLIQPDHKPTFGNDSQTLFIRKNPLTSFSRRISVTSSFSGLPNYTMFYAISTAIYLGYSPIYVIGMDANHYKFLKFSENGVSLLPHHSYPENEQRWRGRETLLRVINTNMQQIHALRLFLGHQVFITGLEKPHDQLPFVQLSTLFQPKEARNS